MQLIKDLDAISSSIVAADSQIIEKEHKKSFKIINRMTKTVGEEQDFEDIVDNPIDVEYMKNIFPNKTWSSAHPDPSNKAISNLYDEGPKSQPSESSVMHYARISKSACNGVNADVSPMKDNGNILDMHMAHTCARARSHSRSAHSAGTDELDISSHYMRGRGWLASKKDVFMNPDIFAEGCKLLQAAAVGNKDYIQQILLENPGYIHFRDYDRRTILHVAASEGKLDIVKMLVEKYRANINRSDRWGGSPLDDAHRHRHNEVATFLRSKGGSTGTTDQSVNLITAAVTGDLPELEMLLTDLPSKSTTSESVEIHTTSSIDINGGDYDGR